jgi:hypothetical protein
MKRSSSGLGGDIKSIYEPEKKLLSSKEQREEMQKIKNKLTEINTIK